MAKLYRENNNSLVFSMDDDVDHVEGNTYPAYNPGTGFYFTVCMGDQYELMKNAADVKVALGDFVVVDSRAHGVVFGVVKSDPLDYAQVFVAYLKDGKIEAEWFPRERVYRATFEEAKEWWGRSCGVFLQQGVPTSEFEAFKQEVAETAMRYADEHDWCDAVTEALTEMGLESYIPSNTVPITLNITVSMTADRGSRTGSRDSSFIEMSLRKYAIEEALRSIDLLDNDWGSEEITEVTFEASNDDE